MLIMISFFCCLFIFNLIIFNVKLPKMKYHPHKLISLCSCVTHSNLCTAYVPKRIVITTEY